MEPYYEHGIFKSRAEYDAYRRHFHIPLSAVADLVCCERYHPTSDFIWWNSAEDKTAKTVTTLLTYLVPRNTGVMEINGVATLIAEHLLDVIDKKTGLNREMLRTLLLATDKDVRLWAIQHASLK